MIKFEVIDITQGAGSDSIVSCRGRCGSKMDIVFINGDSSVKIGDKVRVDFDWGEDDGTDATDAE